MKKIFLFVLFAGLLTTGYAQKQSYAEKTSKENASIISKEMDLNKERAAFLETTLLNKYNSVSKQTKGKDLSKEDKKAIYKESHQSFVKNLSEKFSKEEINKIKELLKKQNQQNKKT